MATAIGTPAPDRTGGNGGGHSGGRGGGNRGGGGGGNDPYSGRLGMWFALAAVMMFFMGLTSAFIVRRGLDPGWDAIAMPRFAAVNAAVLLASSLTFELARRTQRTRDWLLATWILGVLFIGGQLLVWRELANAGLYMGNSPHSSFVYLLTAAHGFHLLGGMAALSWIIWMPAASKALRERRTGVTALYWHFMDGLWVYLLVLLFIWK